MTRFWKNGFWRTNALGNEFWVEGHWVERTDWSRWTYAYTPRPQPRPIPPSPPKDLFLEEHPEFTKERRTAACFVNPNATCPVCGERVFYYQNEHGSRVFFDNLGPPWPKHPCTDARLTSTPLSGTQLGQSFTVRSQPEIAEIISWQATHGHDFESEFMAKHGTKPWVLGNVLQRMKAKRNIFIIANLLTSGTQKQVYFSCKKLPTFFKAGLLFALHRQKISFLDPTVMEPVEIVVKKYRSAAAFLNAFVANSGG